MVLLVQIAVETDGPGADLGRGSSLMVTGEVVSRKSIPTVGTWELFLDTLPSVSLFSSSTLYTFE